MDSYVYLAHYGITGQKWGHRRFQNEDGTLTPAGRERYGVGPAKANRKVNGAELAVYEVGYHVKRGLNSLKNDAKQIGKNVRDAAKERFTEPSRSARKAKAAMARERQKAEKLEKKKARLEQKLIEKQNKRTISDLKRAIQEESMNRAKREVERLTAKRDAVKEKAAYKEAAKQLRKEVKNAEKEAKREARKMYSRNKIRSLSDEELNARISRLKKEAELRSLEVAAASPVLSSGMKTVGNWLVEGTGKAVKELVGASATSVGKSVLGLSDDEISEYVRLTKKK